jgi:DNA-binding Lrp family transcriptional regulator
MSRPKGHSLDEVDLKIVAALMKKPDLTLEELGQIVGKRPTVCKQRKDFLLKNGYVVINASISPKASKWKYVGIYLVKLPSNTSEMIDEFARQAARFPEITMVDQVTGRDSDLVLRIEATDGERYEDIRRAVLAFIPGTSGDTYFVLTTLKRAPLPPEALLPLDIH